MKNKETVSGLVLLILSIFVCIGASQLSIGSFNEPGTGLFPFLLGVVIGFLSLILLLKRRFEKKILEKETWLWSGAGSKRRVTYILIALVLYGLFLEKMGYIVTTFLLFIFLFVIINPQKWYVAMGIALLASLGSYTFFQLGLNVQLPRGFLGI